MNELRDKYIKTKAYILYRIISLIMLLFIYLFFGQGKFKKTSLNK